jgi:hypothetical protein
MTCRNLRQSLRDRPVRPDPGAKFSYRCVLKCDPGFCAEVAGKLASMGLPNAQTSPDCPFCADERERCPYFCP